MNFIMIAGNLIEGSIRDRIAQCSDKYSFSGSKQHRFSKKKKVLLYLVRALLSVNTGDSVETAYLDFQKTF